jgi:D-alanyl-D-alanine carboxypeptidase/D-alanyl-D-alanine-endopeptidase (penicillin-binding protein 4)
MLRRCSPLIAVFLLSGLLTRAGFAGASTAQAEAARAGGPVAEVPASVEALLDEAGPGAPKTQHEIQVTDDWPARIEARLAALRPVERDAGSAPNRRLRTRVEAALAAVEAEGRVGVEIRDLDSGEVLLARDPHRLLNPASNQKLITAIAAVELLGPDYRFETTVSREGDALILRGEGDPDLHVRDLHRLAGELAGRPELLAGVRRILVDDGAFDTRSLGPGFRSDGPGESYIAPSGALALDYSTIEISVTPGPFRGPAQIHIEPAGAAIELRGDIRTGHGSPRVTTRAGTQGRTIVELSGAIPGGHAPIVIRRRVADPGLVAGTCFAELLAAHTGATPLPVARGRGSTTARVLATHESAPLLAVLASAMRYSNNFTAEQVLRTLAWRASGRPGSWEAGVEVLERFAAAVSPSGASEQRFVNGSGLTHDGRLSPAFVVDALALSTQPGSPTQTLLASFAKAGGEGTLRNRLAHADARVLAKTGTYAGASSLSGVVRDGSRTLGFSILINGAELEHSRAAQDRIVAALLRVR